MPYAQHTDAIHNYRTELATETERVLDQTEKDLEKQLADITEEFSGKLQIVADYEDDIFKSISEERLEITSDASTKDGQTCKQQASLADRMRDFEKIVAVEADHLDQLWREWQKTQLELVCLAIAVLGLEGVELSFDQDDECLRASVQVAVDSCREHEAACADVKKRVGHVEKSIRTIADNAISHLNEQEKVRLYRRSLAIKAADTHRTVQSWKINEKKKIQKIKRIMMETD